MGELSRKEFLQAAGALGVACASGVGLSSCSAKPSGAGASFDESSFETNGRGQILEATYEPSTGELTVNEDVLIRYGVCVGCYCGCGLRLKIDRKTGDILGQAGNPYNPSNAYPTLAFEEPLTEAYKSMVQAPDKKTGAATCCGRSLGNLDAYLNANRITTPLKRAGARGEGKWKPITWDELITEVVEGGKLFADLGEEREIEGYRALWTDEPIDSDSPEFGAKRNQLVHFGGRLDGRGMTSGRFYTAFGTRNQFSHLATCYGPRDLYYTHQTGSNDLSMDTEFVEYAIWCGTFPGANGGSVQNDLKRLTYNMENGLTKVDVFDPNLCSGVVTSSQKNATWHPIKAATNTAFALALARWIIENKAYNEDYLSAPNYKTAIDNGFGSCCNASHLVIVDEAHENYRKMLAPADAGISESSLESEFDRQFVVIDEASGQPMANLDSAKGLLEYEGEINGIKVKTAFLLFKESAYSRTLEEYSEICGVSVDVIKATAKEFTSHGVRAAIHGIGGSIALNGVDAGSIYVMLGALIGSIQMKGGYVVDYVGVPTVLTERYSLAAVEGAPAKGDVSLARTRFPFEKTSEYQRRVAAGETNPKPLLPWYPVGVTQGDNQALFSVINKYPYATKILVTWQSNTLNATPGAMRDEIVEKLKDPDIVPLHIASDVVEGTFARIADYFVPDLMYRETFGVQGKNQCFHARGSFIAWPMVEPKTMLLDDGRHASFDAFLCDVAKACGLPGYGKDALKSTDGTSYDFNDACDYYLKSFANLAYFDEPVEDITEEEMHMQGLDNVPDAWKSAVSDEEWPKVLKVMSRGCRVWPVEEAYDEAGRALYGTPMMSLLYSESRACGKNSMTGEYYNGTLTWTSESFSDSTPIDEYYSRSEYPFAAASYKAKFRSTSMLSNSPIMRELSPENFIEINVEDAASLGVKDGDMVQVENPAGDVMVAPAAVRAGTAKGVFGVAFGYSQYAYGSKEMSIGDDVVEADPSIAKGVSITQMLDPTLSGTLFAMSDPEGGTGGRNGGMFKITKMGE